MVKTKNNMPNQPASVLSAGGDIPGENREEKAKGEEITNILAM